MCRPMVPCLRHRQWLVRWISALRRSRFKTPHIRQVFTSAQIIARIGTETILASDLLPLAEDALQPATLQDAQGTARGDQPEEVEKTRVVIRAENPRAAYRNKMKYADAVANIPRSDCRTSRRASMKTLKTRLKSLMEKYGAANRSELEAKMAAASNRSSDSDSSILKPQWLQVGKISTSTGTKKSRSRRCWATINNQAETEFLRVSLGTVDGQPRSLQQPPGGVSRV